MLPTETESIYKLNSLFSKEEDGCCIVETSPEDLSKIEEFLKFPQGFFSIPFVIKAKLESCADCNRKNIFLDIEATGLIDKTAEIKKFFRHFGYIIIDEASNQQCFCYGSRLQYL